MNEGFATWVSYLATDGLFPEWNIWTQFLDELTEGLRLDGLEESQPIEVEINHEALAAKLRHAIEKKQLTVWLIKWKGKPIKDASWEIAAEMKARFPNFNP